MEKGMKILLAIVAWQVLGPMASIPTPLDIVGNLGIGGTDTVGGDVDVTESCDYAPTFVLRAADKWNSGVTMSASHLYQINDGASQTYSTAVTANKGDTIDVLWGNGNATTYNDVDTYTVSKCGLNQFPESGNKLLVDNTSVTITCFDENADAINDAADNYTMGSGETATVDCRIKIDTAQKGIPHGGVMVAELASGTTYKEEVTSITGGPIAGSTSVPGSHTLSAAANKAVAFTVNPIVTTGYQDFSVYIAAETGQDPGTSNDVTLTLYTTDCYENSDSGAYECAVDDEDNALTGWAEGTETISID